jgi:AraC-like DNA-binding protein
MTVSAEASIPTTRRGGVVLDRSVRFAGGAVLMRHRFVGDDVRVIVTHEAALRSLVEVRSGALSFPLAGGEVFAPRRFVLAVPPRCVLPIRFRAAEVVTDGVGAPRALDRHAAAAMEVDGADARAHGEVLARLDPDAGVPPPIVHARACLHELLDHVAPVQRAAERVGIAPETLARAFARAYGITPKQYCHRARLFDAAIRLLEGASVLDAALRAGFNDLTRFYVQFRGLLGSTPGRYARIRRRLGA